VPPLSVQTLVENSIKYAISPRREGGRIEVTVRADAGRLVLEVWDDGPGFAIESIAPNHGLDNLRSRLQTLFAEHSTLQVEQERKGMGVRMVLPWSTVSTA